MDGGNQEVIYCTEADDYRTYCGVCGKLCLERYYKNLFI